MTFSEAKMLFIITGMTGEIATKAKELFKAKNLKTIGKSEIEHPTRTWTNKVELPNIKEAKWDYEYEINEKTVRLSKSSFIDAINDECNAVISISSENSKTISEIKSAFDVKTIFVYIEEKTLESTIKKIGTISQKDIERRLNIGSKLKKMYLENISLYDNMVVYDEQANGFSLDDALKQLEAIIDKSIIKEKYEIELPYKGKKPYAFVSYSHHDRDTVLPILEELRKKGCRIWYDEAISAGEMWVQTIATKVDNCSQFIVFSSKNSTNSRYVALEVFEAQKKNKPMLRVKIDDSEFQSGIEMLLNAVQHLDIYDIRFDEKLFDAIEKQVADKKN